MPKVALVMGSKSDLPALEGFFKTMNAFGVEYCARVLSAHRTPEEACRFARGAQEAGIEVICAAAGKAAHLAGVLASQTVLPIIGIPVKSSTMDGLDSLLSTVQMPSGIPVATVAIGGAENAALLALQILGLKYPEIQKKLAAHRERMTVSVLEADAKLQEELHDYV